MPITTPPKGGVVVLLLRSGAQSVRAEPLPGYSGIRELGMPARTTRFLEDRGVKTIKALCKMTPYEMRGWYDFGLLLRWRKHDREMRDAQIRRPTELEYCARECRSPRS